MKIGRVIIAGTPVRTLSDDYGKYVCMRDLAEAMRTAQWEDLPEEVIAAILAMAEAMEEMVYGVDEAGRTLEAPGDQPQ